MRPGCASHVYTPLYTPAVQRCPCAVCAILNLLFSRQSFVISSAISRARSSRCAVCVWRRSAPLPLPGQNGRAPGRARRQQARSRFRPQPQETPQDPDTQDHKDFSTVRLPSWVGPTLVPGRSRFFHSSVTPCHPASPGCDRPRPVSHSGGAVPLPPPMPPGPHHGRLSTGPQSGPRSEKE